MDPARHIGETDPHVQHVTVLAIERATELRQQELEHLADRIANEVLTGLAKAFKTKK